MERTFLNRVAFSLGDFEIYWYGIIMAFAILVAFLVAIPLFKKKGHNSTVAFEAFITVVVTGIVGARLFSVLFEQGSNIKEFFNIRDGGMSIIGAVIGGALGLGVLSLIKKKNYFVYSDVVAVVLILAQAIGRWGNYANEEVYGKLVSNKAWQFFPFAVQVNGSWYHALFFYEFVLNLVGFGILLFVFLKFNKKGLATGAYLVYYGLIRSLLEPLRSPTYILKFHGVPVSQALAILMMTVGAFILTKIISEMIAEKKKKAKRVGTGGKNV